jgi:hypothetical protein
MKIAVLDDYLGYSDRYADWGALGNGVAVFRDPIPAESLAETLARLVSQASGSGMRARSTRAVRARWPPPSGRYVTSTQEGDNLLL